MTERVTIVGGGLAGSEAAWQLARRGVSVDLFEMRPVRQTPVHQTGDLAELVCSNSLRGNALDQAAGLLKEEMRRMGSLIIRVADEDGGLVVALVELRPGPLAPDGGASRRLGGARRGSQDSEPSLP